MTTERWRKVTRAVDAALELPRIERIAFLDRFCSEDAELCAAANKLLQACERAGTTSGFLTDTAGSYLGTIVADLPVRIADAEDAIAPALGAALGDRYVVERELGRGGMAIVYLARDRRHGRQVALKVLRPELRESIGAKRFLQEVQITAQLTHPHILPLLDSGEAGDVLYYVMPHVAGESLRARLKREIQLPVDEALRIAREVADALDCSHRNGIVHRDIKPENILLEEGHAVVADFGIARAIVRSASDSFTSTGVSLGTPHYMSPEQASGEMEIDGRSDIYAVGCILHEMISGEPPFTGPTVQAVVAKAIGMPPAPLRQLRDSVPEALENLVLRALAKLPADRYQTAAGIRSALDSISNVSSLESTASSEEVAGRRSTNRRTRAILVGIGLALLALGTAAIASPTGRNMLDRMRTGLGSAPNTPARPDWVIVADFDGPASDPTLAIAARELVTTVLDQSRVVATVSASDVRRGLRSAGKPDTMRVDADLGRELAIRGGVRAVVTGRVERVGTSHTLMLRLMNADSGTVLAALSGSAATANDFIPTVDRLGRELREKLGEKKSAIRSGSDPLGFAATPSFEAFRKYVEGHRMVRQQRRDVAVSLWREAIKEDSAFTSAWLALGTQYLNSGMDDSARVAFAEAGRHRGRLSELGRLRLQGLEALVRLDHESSLRAWDLMLLRNPGSVMAHINRGAVLQRLGRHEEAAEATKRGIALLPFGPAPHQAANLSTHLRAVGRWEESRSVALSGEGPSRSQSLLRVALATEDWVSAESVATDLLQPARPTDSKRFALVALGSIRGARGALRDAEGLLRRAEQLPLGFETGSSTRQVPTARLLIQLGSGDSTATEVIRQVAGTTADQVLSGIVAAASSDLVRARAIRDKVRSAPKDDVIRLSAGIAVLGGMIAANEGRWKDVIHLLAPDAGATQNIVTTELEGWTLARWLVAVAFERSAQPDSAARYFEMVLDPIESSRVDELSLRGFVLPFARQRLVLLYSAMGRTADARRHWDAFNTTFTNPDPELKPLIAEARAALSRAGAARQ